MDSLRLPQPQDVALAGILVVDDHDLVRLGLRTLVHSHAVSCGQEIHVFEARTLQEAMAVFKKHQTQIDLVFLDLHLPDAHGLSGFSTFVARFPNARVAVFSGASDPALIKEAKSIGAIAYLSKSSDLPNLAEFISANGVHMKHPVVKSTTEVPPTVRTVRTVNGNVVALSARQSQALDFLLAGHTNKEIADAMLLSEGTVKNHISALLLLFGVRSRAQLISQLR